MLSQAQTPERSATAQSTSMEVRSDSAVVEEPCQVNEVASKEWDMLSSQMPPGELIQYSTTHRVNLTPPTRSGSHPITPDAPPPSPNLAQALFPTPATVQQPVPGESASLTAADPSGLKPNSNKKGSRSKSSKATDLKGKSKADPLVVDDVFSGQGATTSPTLSASSGAAGGSADALHGLCHGGVDEEFSEEIDDAVDAIIKLVESTAGQLDILPSRIYTALDEQMKEPKLSGLTASNAWNKFQLFYKHKPYLVRDLLKNAGSTIVTDDGKSPTIPF